MLILVADDRSFCQGVFNIEQLSFILNKLDPGAFFRAKKVFKY